MPRAASRPARAMRGRQASATPAPEAPPDSNIALADRRPFAAGIGGLTRRMVFDQRVIGEDRQLVVLNLLPGAAIPAHRLRAGAEWFVPGGEARIGDAARARGGSFVILEPGAEAEISSAFGARLIAWADGPVDRIDGAARPDPYGF